MGTIQQAIDAALAKVTGTPVVKPLATDNAVALAITTLAAKGYRPSMQIVEPVRDYLSGYGVLLCGKAGVGKTFLMRCLGSRLRSVEEITGYGLRQIGVWYEWTDGTDLTIDDLGAEATLAEYGAKEDLLKLVIAHRAERQTGRTSITTNLSAPEIAKRYGDRTLSRILGMCRAHTMTGSNARKPRVHKNRRCSDE